MKKTYLILSFILAIFIIFTTNIYATDTLEDVILLGDVNYDNIVDDKDRVYLGKCLNKIEGYVAVEEVADVNVDGIVDWKDYTVLKKYLAKESGYEFLPKTYSWGDVNRDYLINSSDITYLGKYLNGIDGYIGIHSLADINIDGLIDWKDYQILKKHVTGTTGYEELPKSYNIGDVNRDYSVNECDITYLGRYLNGTNGYIVIEWIIDLNCDEIIDWKDYQILKKHVAGEEGFEQLPKSYSYGDINRDDIINTNDVTYLGRYLNGMSGYVVTEDIADLNGDLAIDWQDYRILKKHLNKEEGYIVLPIFSTINVSEDGNDETGDGTFNNPYLTINKAFEQAKSGDKIRLLTDIKLEKGINITEGEYILDLNGFTVTDDENNWIIPFTLSNTAKLTIIGNMEGSVIKTSDNIFYVKDDAKLEIKGGHYINTTSMQEDVYSSVFLVRNKASIKISGGYFEAASRVFHLEALQKENIELLAGEYKAAWIAYVDYASSSIRPDLKSILLPGKVFYDVNTEKEAEIEYFSVEDGNVDYAYINASHVKVID